MPGILWIVTTQWRGQALGCAGDPNAHTPALDALAAEGSRFSNAVTPHPFGPFARAALLTGVRCPENGIRDYWDPLPGEARTIAHRMTARGYSTAWFGAWHLGARDPAVPVVGEAAARAVVPPAERGGFAFWEGSAGGFLLNDPWLHGTRLPVPARFPGYQSSVLCDRAAQWIAAEAGGGRPWFAVVCLESPHPPYAAAADGVRPAGPGAIALPANVPRGGPIEARARRELSGYYAHIAATDRAVGGLIAGAGEAAVVFTSLHGDMHGAHGLFRKGWPHEESVLVPLIVREAGGVRREAGGAVAAPVSIVDLGTLAENLADGGGLRFPERQQVEISMPSVVDRPDQCDRVWSGIRSRTQKEIFNADGSPWLRFDLESDPGEMRNLV